jgi:hypothetical protein
VTALQVLSRSTARALLTSLMVVALSPVLLVVVRETGTAPALAAGLILVAIWDQLR